MDEADEGAAINDAIVERMKRGIEVLNRSPSGDSVLSSSHEILSHKRDLEAYDAQILEELHQQVVASAKSVVSAQEGRPQGATPTFWHATG